MHTAKRALIVIDIQQDYFPGGEFPLWNTEPVLANIVAAIAQAKAQGMPVILVQHIVPAAAGPSPFLGEGTRGAELHPAILAAAADAVIVTKTHADSFVDTTLDATLSELGVEELLVCGMMTQNCVTHTAISRRADEYQKVTVLTDASTTVSEMLHLIAVAGLAPRVTLSTVDKALA